MKREAFLGSLAAAAVLAAACTKPSIASGKYAVTHSDAEWMKILDPIGTSSCAKAEPSRRIRVR